MRGKPAFPIPAGLAPPIEHLELTWGDVRLIFVQLDPVWVDIEAIEGMIPLEAGTNLLMDNGVILHTTLPIHDVISKLQETINRVEGVPL